MAMSIVFFLSSTSFLYLFHYIAQKWHSYIIYWKTHEKVFLHYPYPTPAVNLARLLPGIGGAALFVAFGNFFYSNFALNIVGRCFILLCSYHTYKTI